MKARSLHPPRFLTKSDAGGRRLNLALPPIFLFVKLDEIKNSLSADWIRLSTGINGEKKSKQDQE